MKKLLLILLLITPTSNAKIHPNTPSLADYPNVIIKVVRSCDTEAYIAFVVASNNEYIAGNAYTLQKYHTRIMEMSANAVAHLVIVVDCEGRYAGVVEVPL